MTRLGVSAALVDGRWLPGDVSVADGRIEAVGLQPASGGRVAVSGFVDRQLNGFAGVDLKAAGPAGYATVGKALLRHGVTSYLPTFYSATPDEYVAALGTLREVHAAPPPGARPLGAHLEGPFLNPTWAGAHDRRRLVDPDLALAARLLDAGPVDLVTLAPELPGGVELVRHLVGRGVRVSIGHSDATAEQCRDAVDAGATMLTHCFNAHRRFAGRDPGPAGVALVDPRIEVGVIADGVHVADDSLRLVAAAAGERMVLVTDAIAPAGTDATIWGGVVTVADGAARLADGTLAGSVATMDGCVRHLIALGVAPEVALRAAGGGRLRVGGPADVAVLDDAWQVVHTSVGGF